MEPVSGHVETRIIVFSDKKTIARAEFKIFGHGLLPTDANGTSTHSVRVSIGAHQLPASAVIDVSSTQITVKTPAGTDAFGNVSVTLTPKSQGKSTTIEGPFIMV